MMFCSMNILRHMDLFSMLRKSNLILKFIVIAVYIGCVLVLINTLFSLMATCLLEAF